MLTASGTFLVGVAAVGALFVRSSGDSGSAPTSASSTLDSSATTHPTSTPVPVATTVPGGGDLRALTGLVELRQEFEAYAQRYLRSTNAELSGRVRDAHSEPPIVSAKVPIEWDDVRSPAWEADEADYPVGAAIFAAENALDLGGSDDAPGAFIGASPFDLPPDVLIRFSEEKRTRACNSGATGPIEGNGMEGFYSLWEGCGTGSVVLDLAVVEESTNTALVVFVRLADRGEIAAALEILNTVAIDSAALEESQDADTSWKRPGWYHP